MAWLSFRSLAIAGVVAAAAASPAKANHCCSSAPCCETSCKVEYRQEAYTAYRCESVPETRTRVCTVWKRVPEVRTETCNVCVSVPHVEERTVMQTCWTCKPVTCTVRRCVDRGHWECREVACHSSCQRSHRRHRCGCDSCCEETCCAPPTRTVRVWVSCKTWEECPVTHMQRVCEHRPVTCHVTVCRQEMRSVQHQVCSWKCVPEQRNECYTVWTTRRVPYQATRCVAVSVPCAAPAASACCETTSCYQPCCESRNTCCRHRRSHRRHRGCCESSGCGCGESAGCCQ